MVQAVKDIFAQFYRVKEKGSFAQNISVVFSGNVLNLLLQLAFAPVISRIYGPEAYGEYAYYNLIITNIAFFGAMSLPSVYVLPKSRFEFLSLSKVVVFGVLGLTLLSLLVFLVLNGRWISFDGSYLAIPAIVTLLILNNLNGISGSWNMREKRFRRNTSVGVTSNLFAKTGTLGIGYWWMPTGLGLLSGDFIKGLVVFITQVSWKLRVVIFRFMFRNNWRDVFGAFKKNINVPKYIFPSQLMSKWTSDLPILIIGGYYSKEMLGQYIFALSIIKIPVQLIDNAVRPVFFQKANMLYNENHTHLKQFFIKSLLFSSFLSCSLIILLSSTAVIIFPIIFGRQWEYAGVITSLISLQVLMTAFLNPYADFWRILRMERRFLLLNSVTNILKVVPFVLVFFKVGFTELLVVFSISYSLGLLLLVGDLAFYFYNKKQALLAVSILYVLCLSCYLVINQISKCLYDTCGLF